MMINFSTIKKYSLILFLLINISAFAQKELTPNDEEYTGLITKKDFETGYTQEWFTEGYNAYQADTEVLKKIKNNIKDYHIKVFMGTWCPDSRRETPKLFKLLDQVNFKQENIEVYAMDEFKTTTANYEKDLDINHVPTIIFYDKKGKEVNRFVEFAQESFEEDILKIVTKQPYQNPYAE